MDLATLIPMRSQSGGITRKALLWFGIPCILIALVAAGRMAVYYKYHHGRVEWKKNTLPRLAALSITNEAIARELEALRAIHTDEERPEWVSDHVLLMTNGECLVYAFRHGFNNGSVDHLFLARGSDGRWLYSTYHFCNEMAGARYEDPPGSITEFAKRYSAREFDGKSDDCLQHTWPPKE